MTGTPALRRRRRARGFAWPLPAIGIALLLAGCGSQVRRTVGVPARHPTAGWQVVSARTVGGRKVAVSGGTIAHAAALEVKVAARPAVSTQVDYSVDCEKSATHPVFGTVALRRTPLTVPIPVIPGADACFLDVTASKSASSALSITILVRRASGA